MRINDILSQAAKELENEDIPFRVPMRGIMLETPAAVMLSSELAKKVDFFSVGTNDLEQYTLAADRQNGDLYDLLDPYHEAVLRLVRIAVKNAHEAGKQVEICGKLAADTSLTEKFLDMGIDGLSVSPFMLESIKRAVSEKTVK